MKKTLFITKSSALNWKRPLWRYHQIRSLALRRNPTDFTIEYNNLNKKNKDKFNVASISFSKNQSVKFKTDHWSTLILGLLFPRLAMTLFTSEPKKLLKREKKRKNNTKKLGKKVNKKSTKPSKRSLKGTWTY